MEKESLIKKIFSIHRRSVFFSNGYIINCSFQLRNYTHFKYELCIKHQHIIIPRYMDIYCKSAHDYHPTMAGKRQIWDT